MNPYAKQQKEYLKTKIQTASKEQLVLMLMDGVLRFSEQGRTAIQNKDIEKKHFSLVRSQDIIIELLSGLNYELGGEIATNLSRLYTYAIRRLVDANIKNDVAGIDEVQNIFRNLREAWAVAMDKVNRERAQENSLPDLQYSRESRKEEAPVVALAASAAGGAGLGALSGLSGFSAPSPEASGAGKTLRSLGALGNFSSKKPEETHPRLSVQG